MSSRQDIDQVCFFLSLKADEMETGEKISPFYLFYLL